MHPETAELPDELLDVLLVPRLPVLDEGFKAQLDLPGLPQPEEPPAAGPDGDAVARVADIEPRLAVSSSHSIMPAALKEVFAFAA